MSVEYDFQAGFDLASVDQPTRIQLMQAFNQLAYLSNRSGIVVSAVTPDVTNNPHLKKYGWFDLSGGTTPVLKLYDQSEAAGVNNAANWSSTPVAAGSITNASVNAAAAIAITKLGITGTGAGARALVRINAANTAMEFVAPASVNTTNEIPVNNLVAHSGDGYLKTVGGSVVWVSQATERSAIQGSIIGLNPYQIAAGGAGTILSSDGGITAFNPLSTIVGAGGIALSLINSGGAAAHDILYWTGATWAKITPTIDLANVQLVTVGTTIGADVSALSDDGAVNIIAHNLGSVPKIVRAVLRNKSGGIATTVGYPAGREIPVEHFRNATTTFPAFAVSADSLNICVSMRATANNIDVIPYAGGAYANITKTEWQLKIYAYA